MITIEDNRGMPFAYIEIGEVFESQHVYLKLTNKTAFDFQENKEVTIEDNSVTVNRISNAVLCLE